MSEKLLQQVAIKKLNWHHNYCLLLRIVYIPGTHIIYRPKSLYIDLQHMIEQMSGQQSVCPP